MRRVSNGVKAIRLYAEWAPRGEIGPRDIEGKRAQEGNKFWKNPKVEFIESPVPQIGPTEILIKVKACGICGSDVLMSWPADDGYTRYPYLMANAVIIGHEFSGEIMEVGEKIKEFQKKTGKEVFKIGDPATAQCVINCGICERCKAGDFDSCSLNEERGFSVDGSMAEYIKTDVRHTYSLGALMENYSGEELFFAGSLIEPLAGVYKAIFGSGGGVELGDYSVVIGGGPIGLSAVALLKAAGLSKVILSEPSASRRKIGKEMGADFLINPLEENFKEKVLEATNGRGAGIYFEASGALSKIWPDIEELLQKGSPKSKFILFGHGPGKIEVNPEIFIGGYHKLTGSHGHCGVWQNVIQLVASKLVDPRKMVTRKIKLEEVPNVLEELRSNKEEGKILITF